MKRFSIFLLFSLAMLLGLQAQTVIVSGQVTISGVGVPNYSVTITGIGGITYSNTVSTDANGDFADTITVNTTQGGFEASLTDCFGNIQTANGFFNPAQNSISNLNLDACPRGTGGACQAAFSVAVSSTSPPVASFTDMSMGSTVFTPVTSWAWDFGDGTTGTTQNPVHTYLTAGTYTVCLIITDASGCTDTACQTMTIVLPGPCNANFFFQQGAGNQVFFRDGSSGGSAPYTYNWSFGDGNNSTIQNPVHTYAMAGTYNVCLIVADANGCSDTTCQAVVVTGNAGSCRAGFTFTIGALGVQFTSTSQGLTGAAQNSYQWNFGDGNTSTAQNPLHSYASSGTYTVCLYFTSAGGGMICQDTICQVVTIQGNPSGGTISGQIRKNRIGVGAAKVWLIEHDPVAGTLTAIDSAISGNSPIFGQGYYQFSNVAAGSYRIKAALQQNVDPDYWNYLPTYHDTVLMWNQAAVITLPANGVAAADVELKAGTNPGGPGFIGGLISQGANKRDPGDPLEDVHVYLLDNNDQAISYDLTDANGEFAFSNLAYGTYRVHVEILGKTYTDQFITISSASSSATNVNFEVNSTNIDVTTSLEPTFGTLTRVYPNPTHGWVKLEINLDQAVNLDIELVDLMGRSYSLQRKALPVGEHQLELDVERFSTGIYFLNVKAENQIISYKLIVE